MQYFNRSNGEVDFIKDKLKSEYIPTVRVFNSEINIQPEFKISSDLITENNPQDVISNENNYKYFKDENIIYNNTIQVCKEENNIVVPKYIKRYNFGKFYPNITTNFISNKNYYDSDLHEYLGRYLRAYRDFYGIDVMNFYNCFSNRFISSYTLPIRLYEIPYSLTTKNPNPAALSDNEKIKLGLGGNRNDPQYKLIAFPILFDTEYTIKFYTTNVNEVQYQAVWFNGETPLGAVEIEDGINSGDEINIDNVNPKIYIEQMVSTFTIKIGSRSAIELYYEESKVENEYNKGNLIVEYGTDRTIKNAISKQKNLYIFMKFPSSFSSPIVVLEQPKFTHALNNELLDLPTTENEQVAFSDTLLEYLTNSVISPADPIHKNTYRIQQKLLQNNFYKKYGVGGPNYEGVDIPNYKFSNGIFDAGVHQIIYKAFFDVGIAKIKNEEGREIPVKDGTVNSYYPKGYEKLPNFIGFVDKNVEDLILTVPDDNSV